MMNFVCECPTTHVDTFDISYDDYQAFVAQYGRGRTSFLHADCEYLGPHDDVIERRENYKVVVTHRYNETFQRHLNI